MDAGTIFDDRPRAENLPHLLSGINMEYIGETHQALEQELDYQTYLEDELKNYVARGLYSQHDAVNLQTLIDINREHLESLSPITSLEHMFSEISQKISDRAVDLVNVRDSPAFWDRNLSKNMRACWKTVQRFSYISRVHISNASEYQMFYYNCDHFIKSLHKKAEMNYNRYRDIDTDYPSVSTSRLNTYMTDGLSKFQSLASEVIRLVDKAHRVNPVYLRVRGLSRPVSGIMLCDYSTKNFSLRAGQHVYVLDNAYVTPLNTNSDVTEGSETSECSTCTYCCGLHHHHHPGCENCGVPLSTTTTTETTPAEEGTDSADLAQGTPAVMQRRQPSDILSAVEETTGSSEESTVTSSPGCSHTFCSQREPVMWKVRTSDGSLTVDVPAVTVMINERDEEAIAHAHEIYEFFTSMWREAIDIWLTKGVKALTNYFSTLIEAKHIHLESERIFEQFLDEVQRAFPIQDAESASANKILNEIIETLRTKIRRQETHEKATDETYIRITEVATYRKTVQKVRDHVNQIRRFMKDVEENTRRGYIDTATLKSMGDLKYVYEETVEEHRKLEKMLRQVNAFRTGRKSPGVPVQTIHSTYGKYYSSAEEYSSESDESQYDVERSKDLSPRILYGREETHRVTALTDRPRYVRRSHGGVVVETGELATDSSDESDTGQPGRSSKLLYKPTHRRRGEQVSEVVEETNDTVISSMTLDRKINLEKQIKRPGEIHISPDGRYRSRRQVHVTPGPQKGDVSMVYLQITTAKSTQDTISPTADNRQSRGIQIDIETIPVDAKDVLYVEPRVASWQKNAAGGMTLKHDVSLDPIQSERERRSVPERTMEAIVSGAARTGDHYERGVQMTSRDKYEGIMKPPMFNYVQRSTQTAAYVEPEKVVEIKQGEEVHAAPSVSETHSIVSSFTEAPRVTAGLISSGLILKQADTSFATPKSEISTAISTIAQEPVKKVVPSTIGVSTEQLLRLEDAWTEATIIEKEPDSIIKEVRMVGEKSAPPVEPVPQAVKVRPCQTAKPLVSDFEIQSEIDTQRMESITHLSEEPNEVVITSSEIKKTVTLPAGTMTDLVIQTEREQVMRTEPPLRQRTEVTSAVTSWIEVSGILEAISSGWSMDITNRGITAPEIVVASTVTSSEKVSEPRVVQMNVTTETESEYVSRGTETMVVEEMMPVIRQEKTLEVKAEPVVQPRVVIRYCQSATPFNIHYEGITTHEEAQDKEGASTAGSETTYVPKHLVVVTEHIVRPPNIRTAEIQAYTTVEPKVVPALRPRLHSTELQAQINAEPLETKTRKTEERVQLEGIGISTDASITSLDAWTETVVAEELDKQIVPERTVVVKAEPAPKRVMHSMEIQARLPSAMFIQSVECSSIVSVSTASMTDAMIEPAKSAVVHTVQRPTPELEATISTSVESRLAERGISTESLVTYLDAWTETITIEEPAKKVKIHSTQLQAQIAADILETITHATEEQRAQLEGIGISTEALITCLDAWTEAGIAEEPARLIEAEHKMVVKAEPVVKPIMQSVEIQAVMTPRTAETISVIREESRAMTIVSVECLPRASMSTASMTDAMIEPAKPVVVHSVPPSRPLTEQISSGRIQEYTDVSTVGPVVELETDSTSVETRLEEIGISTEALIKCQDAWAEALLMEAPVHQIEPERTIIAHAEPGMKPVMHKMEIQAVTKAKTMEITTQTAELSKIMAVVTVQTPVKECRSTSLLTEAMIDSAKPDVFKSVPQTQVPVEVISTERRVENTDIGIDAAIPEYITTSTSKDESRTRPSEIISSIWEKDMATTATSVTPAYIPDVAKANKCIMAEIATPTISRGTETILVEEPMPVIQPERVVEVREAPPISLKIGTSQTLLQPLSEGIFTKFEAESVRPITLSTETQTAELKAPYEEITEVVEVPKEVFTISSQTEEVSVRVTATMTESMIEPAKPTLVHSIPPAPQNVMETENIGIQYIPEVRAEEIQVVGEFKEKPITLSVASQVDLISSEMEAVTHISEIPRPDYRSTATITETMVEPTNVAVQAIQPPQPSSMTTSSELYLKQIDTAIAPRTMELSTTVSSIPRVSVSSLGITTEPMAVQVDGWTQAGYAEPEPVIQPQKTVSIVETAPPVQPTKVRIGSLQSPYQIRYEGITSEVEVKEPLAEVEISAVQCLAPAKVILETATSQYIYVPERREAVTEEMAAPKATMRTYEVQVSSPQAEMISSALEVSQADVGIPATERIVGVCRGVETITIEEPVPVIKPERVVEVREAPPIVVKPEPVRVKYL
ncbi:unnamed protein product, partial [Hymenolepis diminuta]|uniref:Integrase catalytic domain-containing protein n=2 Tax=Hymenolepis diminuta TaxID=6216 RepID=A0A0R3ST69_HYMDI